MGVDVFLDLVELLPLVGRDARAFPPRSAVMICPGRGGVPDGVSFLTGLMYFQTIAFSGVTSKIVPLAPEQISVLPFDSRWVPEMKDE